MRDDETIAKIDLIEARLDKPDLSMEEGARRQARLLHHGLKHARLDPMRSLFHYRLADPRNPVALDNLRVNLLLAAEKTVDPELRNVAKLALQAQDAAIAHELRRNGLEFDGDRETPAWMNWLLNPPKDEEIRKKLLNEQEQQARRKETPASERGLIYANIAALRRPIDKQRLVDKYCVAALSLSKAPATELAVSVIRANMNGLYSESQRVNALNCAVDRALQEGCRNDAVNLAKLEMLEFPIQGSKKEKILRDVEADTMHPDILGKVVQEHAKSLHDIGTVDEDDAAEALLQLQIRAFNYRKDEGKQAELAFAMGETVMEMRGRLAASFAERKNDFVSSGCPPGNTAKGMMKYVRPAEPADALTARAMALSADARWNFQTAHDLALAPELKARALIALHEGRLASGTKGQAKLLAELEEIKGKLGEVNSRFYETILKCISAYQ